MAASLVGRCRIGDVERGGSGVADSPGDLDLVEGWVGRGERGVVAGPGDSWGLINFGRFTANSDVGFSN